MDLQGLENTFSREKCNELSLGEGQVFSHKIWSVSLGFALHELDTGDGFLILGVGRLCAVCSWCAFCLV
jgi:hypothetical protein